MQARNAGSTEIKPLTKRTKQGELYIRRADAEMQIEKVLTLDEPQILTMLENKRREEADYLLDETIVYLLREARITGDDQVIDALHGELSRRTLKLLLKFRSGFSQEDFDDFVQNVGMAILRKIFNIGSDAADFAQVQFGSFVISEAKAVWKQNLVRLNQEQNLFETPREDEENDSLENIAWTKELSAESRLIFEEALKKLSPEHQMVAAMLLDGFQIESKNEEETTISRHLDVSSRTIRNWIKEMRQALISYQGEARR